MSNILLAYGNKAPGATLAGGQWDSTLALNNLKTGKLAQVARSSNATVYNTRFRFDLAANYVLRALALVNHNLTTAARWRMKVGTAPLDIDYTAYDDPRDERVSFSGGANRTRVNSTGLIVSKTAPRIDYDPVTLANDGLAVEVGRTNSALYTVTPTVADGSFTTDGGATLAAAPGILGPTGANMSLFAWGGGMQYGYTSAALTAGTAYTYSMYARLGTQADATITMVLQDVTIAAFASATFNLSLGTVTANAAGTAKIENMGGGLYRLSVSGTPANTGSGLYNILLGGANDNGKGHYIGCIQLEAGAFATSYLPTTSAAVTATADVATITGSNFSGWYNASEGTFYVDFDSVATDAADSFVFHVTNAAGTEEIRLLVYGGILVFQVTDGGVSQVSINVGSIVPGQAHRVAVAYKANDFAVSLDGATPVTDASGTIPVPDRIGIGCSPITGAELNGHIRRITYWRTRRTNAELQSLATSGPEALGYDTGWQNALQLTFRGDTPANWGEQYPLIAAFDAKTVRYGTVEIEDTANPDGYVELGQLFVSDGFTTETNPTSLGDGRMDLSSSVKSVGGQKYSTARRRPRKVDLGYAVLTEEEGERMDEMMAEIGTTEDVLYVPDPADPAKSQRYGFLGTLRELTPLEYPFFDHRAMPLRLEQKL